MLSASHHPVCFHRKMPAVVHGASLYKIWATAPGVSHNEYWWLLYRVLVTILKSAGHSGSVGHLSASHYEKSRLYCMLSIIVPGVVNTRAWLQPECSMQHFLEGQMLYAGILSMVPITCMIARYLSCQSKKHCVCVTTAKYCSWCQSKEHCLDCKPCQIPLLVSVKGTV